ncbi:helix-turn-helix domain-containing protein [Fastidiosipila sanguinis]|uniref:XRE family transcriptional regulator n=1 Tax=Fastidiosipila sanguinis TaxID=236753 RepID=A0A2S0KPA1_9FIRM|nr:S24 family peptidase [Fastidiosipila sanguinis]AVM42853.1 XRE family transcriptional regulator [Fastidiosipila sanguinis]
MATFGEKIKAIRFHLGFTQDELAKKLDVTKQVISKYENQQASPRLDTVSEFAEKLNIELTFLINDTYTVEQTINALNRTAVVNFTNSLPSNIIPINKARRIPILGSVACGTPTFAEENIEDYFVTNDIIKADFCLYAKGDSMIEADINDGDLVFVRKTPAVDNGKIAVVLIGEETTLKRVYKTEDSLILHAENRTYQPLIYTEKDCKIENIMVLGEMIGIYKNIKQ